MLGIFGFLIIYKILTHGKSVLESGRFWGFLGEEGFQSGSQSGSQSPKTESFESLNDIYHPERYLRYADVVHHPQGKVVCRGSELYRRVFIGDAKDNNKWNILVLGIETGRFLDAMTGISKNVVGVSKYPELVKVAQANAKNAVVHHLDILNPMSMETQGKRFSPKTFTHIILEDREVYRYTPAERKDLWILLESLLKPGGFLVIRSVDPETFDPLPPTAIPLKGLNIQNYLDKRKTDSVVYLTTGETLKTDFTYLKNSQQGIYKEILESKDKQSRKTMIQTWNMPSKESLASEVSGALTGTSASDSLTFVDHYDLKLCVCVGEYYTIFKKETS
jgi:hypothetical protein